MDNDMLEELIKDLQQVDDIAQSMGVIYEAPDDDGTGIDALTPSGPKFFNGTAHDPVHQKRARMLQVIAKFASTLTLRPIHVALGNKYDNNVPDAPAWSDADNIWFHENHIGDLSQDDTVLHIKGLSLHEIAHILLTPRTGSNLAKKVQKEGLWPAFNALEDQRIEMFMTKRFGNVADWLKATVAKFILDNPEQWVVSYPLLHGRKYLPPAMRTQLRSMYENQADVVELGQLIDKYIVLNLADPANYDIAYEIIKRYNELVMGLQPLNPEHYWNKQEGWQRVKDPAGHSERKHGEWKSSKSKPMSKAEQQKLSDRVSDAVKQDNADNNSEGNGEQDSNTPQDAQSGVGAGTGTGLADLAQDVIDKVKQLKAREIAQTIKQFSSDTELQATVAGTPDRLPTSNVAVSAEVIQASKSFANELERLRAEFEPGWNRRVESGKLNVQRYVTGADLEECFDEWDTGREDAVDIEAVILLDISGSMQAMSQGAYESMWAIKRALDRANASTTVLAFETTPHILYSADERAGVTMKSSWCGGGTSPLPALKYSQNVLAHSSRAIKLCIAITDGMWDNSSRCDDVLREFRNAGVLTALAYVEDPSYFSNEINTHGCEVAVQITNTSDLFGLARGIVSLGIQRNLVNATA